MANTVPAPELPPPAASPYSVLPAELVINPACGSAPSVLVEGKGPDVAVKLCRTVKVCAVTRPAGIKLSTATSAGRSNRLIRDVFINLIFILRFCFNGRLVRHGCVWLRHSAGPLEKPLASFPFAHSIRLGKRRGCHKPPRCFLCPARFQHFGASRSGCSPSPAATPCS